MLQRVAARWPDQVVFLNPADFLCEDQCLVSNGGMSLYFDFSHLTVAGARFFASRAAPALTRFLNK